MKFSIAPVALSLTLSFEKAFGLPGDGELMELAFPYWEVDDNGERVERKPCSVDSCEWNPFYLTKRYDGLHPDFGGHPTDIDVGYAFYYASPFAGQSGGGSPHHCPLDHDGQAIQACPKIKTYTDSGPSGPGHVPPHISLASLKWAVGRDELVENVLDLFNYERYGCRVIPDELLKLIRNYFPRTEGELVAYPPPFTPEGGDFQFEFSSGRGVDNQEPPYEPGPPHWCTQEYLDSGNWPDFCPYVFEGPDAGQYRHPHIAYAALEVYLANQVMPELCGVTWLENNPDFLDPDRVTTNIAFPKMDADEGNNKRSVARWLGQPSLPYKYPRGNDRDFMLKAASGEYVTEYVYA
uniref:Uncharacterized protein n=1 Tax=Ditylum brightwellii TaxID=49249 RepID=A0A7S4UGS6_9STRA